MIEQNELDDIREDAERGHGIDDCERVLDLIQDINRLNRIMPHIGGTCKWHKNESNCGYRYQEERVCWFGDKCRLYFLDKDTMWEGDCVWELKE